MEEHSIFYYPYASFTPNQAPLLKAAAVYFDKIYMLDPRKASWGTIGPGDADRDIALLEREGLLERISPEDILKKYEGHLSEAIRADVNDAAFQRLCASRPQQRWTLALAKIPQPIRDDPKFAPLDQTMQRVMGELPGALGAGAYAEDYAEVYDEYREDASGATEYRYADFPLPIGEAIMINHALFGGLLHTGATPLTDVPFHQQVLDLKMRRARETPEIAALIEDRATARRLRRNALALQTLTDVDLAIVSPEMPMAEILEFRERHDAQLGQLRTRLSLVSRTIREEPWTDDFGDTLEHDLLPALHTQLEDATKARNAWLESDRGRKALSLTGIAAGAAVAILGLAFSAVPLTPVALVTGGLTLASGSIVPGLQVALEWKKGSQNAQQNGLHYLVSLKRGN